MSETVIETVGQSVNTQQLKRGLTDTQRDVLDAWSNDFNASLDELAEEASCTGATVSNTIKKYGWLVDESLWLDRKWQGDAQKIIQDTLNTTTQSATKTDSQQSNSKAEINENKDKETDRLDTQAVGPSTDEIDGIEELKTRMKQAEDVREWSFILNDYIKWGNNTTTESNVGIFSLGSGHDCPNRATGNCQVDEDECYAIRHEKQYDYVLDFTRRQEFLWDKIHPEAFVEMLLEIISRKQGEVDAIRFNQAGDFRNNQDVWKVNRIAELLNEYDIVVYTYSASNYLDWSQATSDNFIVNQSNDIENYGDRHFIVLDDIEDIPEDTVWCPYDRDVKRGRDEDDRIKCGECMMCMDDKAGDIAVTK